MPTPTDRRRGATGLLVHPDGVFDGSEHGGSFSGSPSERVIRKPENASFTEFFNRVGAPVSHSGSGLTMARLVSPAEYARIRGVSKTAVAKAVRSGRISTTNGPTGRKLIDPDVADLQWAANTDIRSQRRGAPSEFEKTQPRARAAEARINGDGSAAPSEATAPDQAASTPDRSSLLEESTRLARVKTQIAEMDLQQRRGELVGWSAIRAAYAMKLLTARELLLAIPDRLAAALAAERDPNVVSQLLAAEIRIAMIAASEEPSTARH